MTAGSAAAIRWRKAVKMGLSLFRSRFNSSKCKTFAKMAVARIKLLRNKREVVVRQMRRDVAMLLESGQDGTARVRVEHVIREQNIMAANEFIELFCELVVARLPIIAKQRECPADLKEGISSLIFAAPRCSDIPELLELKDVFEKKYGKDFVSAATDLRPNAGVNRTLIEKLSVRTPSGEVKLKILKEIAKEFQVPWDTTESEAELLKPPEERIKGPNNFVSASNLPLKPTSGLPTQPDKPASGCSNRGRNPCYENAASAAEAAAESARKAIAAAEAAAHLASGGTQVSRSYNSAHGGLDTDLGNFTGNIMPNGPVDPRLLGDQPKMVKRNVSGNFDSYSGKHGSDTEKSYRRHSYNVPRRSSDIKFDDSDCEEDIEAEEPPANIGFSLHDPNASRAHRRHSYNAPSDIKFDESDCDDESDVNEPMEGGNWPPDRPAPQVPSAFRRVHPKLPDYDTLAARFEALKYRKSQD